MVTFRYSTEVQLHFERTHLPLGCTFTLLSDGNVPGGRHSEGVPDLAGGEVVRYELARVSSRFLVHPGMCYILPIIF